MHIQLFIMLMYVNEFAALYSFISPATSVDWIVSTADTDNISITTCLTMSLFVKYYIYRVAQ